MNTGMMWLIDDQKVTLDISIQKAADYYRQKYGRVPDMCLVNPKMVDATHPERETRQVGKIIVRPLRSVLPGHLWIGVNGVDNGNDAEQTTDKTEKRMVTEAK